MTTIFLNLGPRKVGGELIPDVPFRAFVKFETKYDDTNAGGIATLHLQGSQTIKATIDWRKSKWQTDEQKGNYLVATGALDEVESKKMSDWKKVELIIEAMVNAGWLVFGYSSEDDTKTVNAEFKKWIRENL